MIEIIGFDIENCQKAERNGANRIELCAQYHLGGVTPSLTLIKSIKKSVQIPVFLMVRPRGGNFVYHTKELNKMIQTIRIGLEYEMDGFVFGALTSSNEIDKNICRALIAECQGKPCTLHRAFDVVNDPFIALDTAFELGFDRILTSGLAETAFEGRRLLKALIERAGQDIIVMPGGGVNSQNIAELMSYTLAQEYHASAKIVNQQKAYLGIDEQEIRQLVHACSTHKSNLI